MKIISPLWTGHAGGLCLDRIKCSHQIFTERIAIRALSIFFTPGSLISHSKQWIIQKNNPVATPSGGSTGPQQAHMLVWKLVAKKSPAISADLQKSPYMALSSSGCCSEILAGEDPLTS